MQESDNTPLLQVENLKIDFHNRKQTTNAVKGISFQIAKNETVAIIGESGSGKSVTALSLTRLLPPEPICTINGKMAYKGKDLTQAPEDQLRDVRGKDIAYIFQDPGTSLNPVFTVGSQIAEAVKLHLPHITNVKSRVIEALKQVDIHHAARRYHSYPHELSSGMQQRVMIAMALACEPKILVADEPTTALDVTIQKQIIDLLKEIKRKHNMSIILITHNFGIISGFVDRVLVMYQGNIVERGETKNVLKNPQHPYTKALINCIPKLGTKKDRLTTIDHNLIDQQSA